MQEVADGGSGTITFSSANRMHKSPTMLYAEQPREVFVQIEIMGTDGQVDQTGMFVGDNYSDDIDFDDYEKMFGSSTNHAKLWIMHDNHRLAFEAKSETTAADNTFIGYRAPEAGTYYFNVNLEASDLNDIDAIYLSDNLVGVTDYDLLDGAYEFESEATIYNDHRFSMRLVLRNEAPGTATDIEDISEINSGSKLPCKFIYRDRMYILHNGIVYDITGQRIVTINK